MTQGPEATSLSPEALARALWRALPFVVAVGVVGYLLRFIPG